jgi:lipopolysaccharide/colanic/teichoic acid biosynthesis glycosyltransferase
MRRFRRRQLLLLIDLVLIAVATVLALILRDNLEVSSERLLGLVPYLGLTLIIAAIVLSGAGINRSIWRLSAMSDYLRLVACVVVIVGAAVAFGFLTNRLEGVARALPIIQGLLMASFLVGVRVAMRLRHAHRHKIKPAVLTGGEAQETVLIVGLNAVTELFLRSVAEFAPRRLKIAGVVGRSEQHSGRLVQQYRILGVPEEIEKILRDLEVHGVSVNRIVITTAAEALSSAARNALLKVERSSEIRLDFFSERIGLDERSEKVVHPSPSRDTEQRHSYSVVELEARASHGYLRSKRIFDLLVAATLISLLLPLIVLVGFVVVLDVGLPAVFWQQRPGYRGRPFKLYKFRTMGSAHDAHGRRIPDEERLSRIGRFLRRTRLDELPQLYNILIGEMSFVGPRPLLPIDQTDVGRLLIRPGLTGWAQVMGGREIGAQDKAALDIWYLRNASLRLDLEILARTVPTILFGERVNAAALRNSRYELGRGALPADERIAKPSISATIISGVGQQHAA